MNAKELGAMLVNGTTPELWVQSAEEDAKLMREATHGITLRQHFAGLAMQGLCGNQEWMKNAHTGSGKSGDECVAIAAIEMADALLAELAKDQS